MLIRVLLSDTARHYTVNTGIIARHKRTKNIYAGNISGHSKRQPDIQNNIYTGKIFGHNKIQSDTQNIRNTGNMSGTQ